MSRCTRLASALALAVAALLAPAAPVFAHGGSDCAVTSNYRIEITSISPTVAGLDVRTIDVDGTIQIAWTGAGTLTVDGSCRSARREEMAAIRSVVIAFRAPC